MKDIRILLCEDDPSLGRLLSDYLKAKGFEVTWAQDGVEGLKAFHRDTFDFIVLDVMMPRKMVSKWRKKFDWKAAAFRFCS